jgi:hypothetical protein
MDNNYYCALDHWNFVRQQALIRAGPARRRSSVQVTSYKLQATSNKQQATSNKQQASGRVPPTCAPRFLVQGARTSGEFNMRL